MQGSLCEMERNEGLLDTNPRAPETAKGVLIPMLLISASNLEITFNDCGTKPKASGGNF